jgi:hypothetical protein
MLDKLRQYEYKVALDDRLCFEPLSAGWRELTVSGMAGKFEDA